MTRILRLALPLLLLGLVATAGEPDRCQSPPDECERQIRAMLTGKKFLGITMADSGSGPVIRSVVPNSPAERAGFQAGDRIIGVNAHDCSHASPQDVKRMLTPLPQNARVMFMVIRLAQLKRISVRFGTLPKEQIDQVVEAHLRNGHSDASDTRTKNARADRR